MTRTGKLVILCSVLALAGCGQAGAAPEAPPESPVASAAAGGEDFELVALEAAGFAEEGEARDGGEEKVRPRAVRRLLRQNTLHGEVVVQGRDGVRTIVVQRGDVTAADDAGFTVKSADGFTLTWAYGDPLRVVQNHEKAERDVVRPGVRVAVGGARDGAKVAARLIVVR
ncbi:hypothetical protein AMIS_64550 [Actinoplanes missouriensis 431]|uniref:DUF5666 domain-containing protein n=1 Tax=Actinoplanes missouriensis (strain ATCC 14538 / DSM 43046 / CBS 188.64 / JCM 3121 / NBRC 102363 / NCIMB 12654 / NRRL B-3342 / UNCC 431) TaxID=512565 RepID=I0HF88_ACTM4|nr:hypothetical protein [Actinoplanes missouriensis]BAL91675.1 hypothetical protein AMIS_64550 [Actinoplanes missouriensis 431]